MRAVILLALLGTIMADPLPYYGARIVGGSDTTVDRYPFITNMQRLYWGSFWSQACGGSLITASTIVSAAHCYHGDLPHQWRVRVGTSLASSGGDVHNIEELVIHEQYERPGPLNNDVAIVRLATSVTFSANVQPVRLAGPHYDVSDGDVLTVIGWGALQAGGSAPEQLQHVDVHYINQQLCVERYGFLKTQEGFLLWPDITDEMLCAGIQDVGGKDACQGDSGGPVVHNGNVLVGVVSWGYGCADSYFPGVNARVSALSSWIAKHGAA